jgi:hypothetical protein
MGRRFDFASFYRNKVKKGAMSPCGGKEFVENFGRKDGLRGSRNADLSPHKRTSNDIGTRVTRST